MGGDSPKNYESFDREAAKQRAELTREQWEDYKTRFSPWEEKLIAFNTDPNIKGLAESRAREGVNTAFTSGIGQYKRDQSRVGLGTSLNAAESRTLALGKATATAQATNDARTYTDDRKEKIMTSGLGAAAGQVRV